MLVLSSGIIDPNGSRIPLDSTSAMAETGGTEKSPGARARALVRAAERASLATSLPGEDGARPYASLVLVAADHDGSPLLLLSDLAEHSRNLAADPRVALLFDGTAGWREPLAGPRVSLLGRAERAPAPRLKARFVARHPGAAVYAGFADFHLYRVAVERAHLIAGFGEIRWLDAKAVLFESQSDTQSAAALTAAEADILDHMNSAHVPDEAEVFRDRDRRDAELRPDARLVHRLLPDPVEEDDPLATNTLRKVLVRRADDDLLDALTALVTRRSGSQGVVRLELLRHRPEDDPERPHDLLRKGVLALEEDGRALLSARRGRPGSTRFVSS